MEEIRKIGRAEPSDLSTFPNSSVDFFDNLYYDILNGKYFAASLEAFIVDITKLTDQQILEHMGSCRANQRESEKIEIREVIFMKKSFCLMLAICMIIGMMLTGCGNKDTNIPATDTNIDTNTDVVIDNQNTNMPGKENTSNKYIKNGKFNYSDIMSFYYRDTDGEITVEFVPYGPAANELCEELKALRPDIAKTTIRNFVGNMINVENIDYAAKQERGIQNGDVVTIEVSVIQTNVDMWNEYFGDIELIIEPTYTTTVEGLE